MSVPDPTVPNSQPSLSTVPGDGLIILFGQGVTRASGAGKPGRDREGDVEHDPDRHDADPEDELARDQKEDDERHLEVVTMGRGVDLPHSTGVFGGYPGCTVAYALHDESDLWDQETFPPTQESMSDPESVEWGVTPLDTNDVFYLRFPGSGGYGDPLGRDAESVGRDVAEGTVDPEEFCLREFLCPECGALHDTEVSHRDDPYLFSRLSL